MSDTQDHPSGSDSPPTFPIPDTAVEAAARKITHERLRYYGLTEEQIALSEQPRVHTDECMVGEAGWECFDENLTPFHPEHDEADLVAEFVMFVLEHALAAALATGEVRQEWTVATTHRTRGGHYESHYDDRGDLDRTLKSLGRNTEYRLESIESRSVVTFPDGSQWTSAWRSCEEAE